MLELKEFKIDYLCNPIGIDVTNPRFSWKLKSDENDVKGV